LGRIRYFGDSPDVDVKIKKSLACIKDCLQPLEVLLFTPVARANAKPSLAGKRLVSTSPRLRLIP